MFNQIKPIFIGSIITNSRNMIEITRLNGDMLKVRTDPVFFRKLIRACNGMETVENILKQLSSEWQEEEIIAIIRIFLENGILSDSRSIAGHVWEVVKNPTHFFHHTTESQVEKLVLSAHKRHMPNNMSAQGRACITQGLDLMNQRISLRTFREEPIQFQQLTNILWACYGKSSSNLHIGQHTVSRHTIPSAGALYPLSISVVLFMDILPIYKGVYRVWFGDDSEVFYEKISDDTLGILQSLADPLSVENASAIVVISGDFGITEEKYANRTLLYVPLEAGHAAQNALLASTQESVAAVELGGFMEDSTQRILQHNTYVPLTTIALGNPSDNFDKDYLIPSSIEIEWAPAFANNYRLPFCMVFLRSYKHADASDWCNGRSKNPAIALAKARSEFIERDGCNCIPKLFSYPYNEIADHALDPRKHIRYHEQQYASHHFPYAPFDNETQYLWHKGEMLVNGIKTYILADTIFFPFAPQYAPYTSANSTGAATHPSKKEAIKNALLEVVERDAFMISWLNRLPLCFFETRSLPREIQQRIVSLEESGFKVLILDAAMDIVPVVICVAKSTELEMLTVFASANFVYEEAIDHALTEIEGSAYCALAHGVARKKMHIRDVKHTDDHGDIYTNPQYYGRADFLISGDPVKLHKSSSSIGNIDQLVSLLTARGHTVVVANLYPKTEIARNHASVKVFVSGLVPMTFGYREEPCGMSRVYELPVKLGMLKNKKYYRELNRFPHPFT